jgi:hypothetical protein
MQLITNYNVKRFNHRGLIDDFQHHVLYKGVTWIVVCLCDLVREAWAQALSRPNKVERPTDRLYFQWNLRTPFDTE